MTLVDSQIEAVGLSLLTPDAGLLEYATVALRRATRQEMEAKAFFLEERNVWRPDTWLIQRCWEALAAAGQGAQALDVARLAAARNPLYTTHALYRTAVSQVGATTAAVIGRELRTRQSELLAPLDEDAIDAALVERLLYSAATAGAVGARPLALSLLERLDQIVRTWETMIETPEQRTVLAHTLAGMPPHPLVMALLSSAIRRYGEAGAILIQEVSAKLPADTRAGARLLAKCVETIRFASLTTMHSQRVAVTVMARAGLADAVRQQLATIETIQEARRESGLALRKNDQQLLRQVKRPQANADIDFLVYTLQEAIRAMPVRAIDRDERIHLAQRLATLGMRSDGWTAAGAAVTLVELGARKLAVDVIEHIAPTDPTRSEGAISLVRSLLSAGEETQAEEQTQAAMAWAQSQEGKTVARATIWGLAEVYLDHGRPDRALSLLEQRVVQPGVFERLRNLFQDSMTDEQLRDNRLRLRAYLQFGDSGPQVRTLITELRTWAPQLLDGEALINFYIDGLLAPLLEANRASDVQAVLAELARFVGVGSGSKHSLHLQRISRVVLDQLATTPPDSQETWLPAAAVFLRDVWAADATKGIWQTVHGIDGALPLIIALEGPDAVVEIARLAATEGDTWMPPSD